jgi:hypothetical protein
MEYVLMIYRAEGDEPKPGSPEFDEQLQGYGALTQEVQQAGVHKGGEALADVATATTVRVRDGKTVTTDGPFAETKEQLGGFYLLDCKDLDQAIEYAAKIPAARFGSVEIRPVIKYG